MVILSIDLKNLLNHIHYTANRLLNKENSIVRYCNRGNAVIITQFYLYHL